MLKRDRVRVFAMGAYVTAIEVCGHHSTTAFPKLQVFERAHRHYRELKWKTAVEGTYGSTQSSLRYKSAYSEVKGVNALSHWPLQVGILSDIPVMAVMIAEHHP